MRTPLANRALVFVSFIFVLLVLRPVSLTAVRLGEKTEFSPGNGSLEAPRDTDDASDPSKSGADTSPEAEGGRNHESLTLGDANRSEEVENPWDLSVYPEEDLEMRIEIKNIGFMKAVSITMKGRRTSDEDEISTLEPLSEHVYFMGVFDGHGGVDTAKYLKLHAYQHLGRALNVKDNTPLDISEAAIADACVELDKDVISSGPGVLSGSTAAMLIIEQDILSSSEYIIHSVSIGDSRVYALDLAKKETTPLSHDHKPELPGEKERIVLSGGTVENVDGVWRVDGTLAMSRAFGDAGANGEMYYEQDYKDYANRPPNEQRVCALPTQQTITVEDSTLLLLACDGLFETIAEEELLPLLGMLLQRYNGQLVPAAASLLLTAYIRGSGDNISLILGSMGAFNPFSSDAEAAAWGSEALIDQPVVRFKVTRDQLGALLKHSTRE